MFVIILDITYLFASFLPYFQRLSELIQTDLQSVNSNRIRRTFTNSTEEERKNQFDVYRLKYNWKNTIFSFCKYAFRRCFLWGVREGGGNEFCCERPFHINSFFI